MCVVKTPTHGDFRAKNIQKTYFSLKGVDFRLLRSFQVLHEVANSSEITTYGYFNKEGTYTKYFKNGNKEEVSNFLHGRNIGLSEMYFSNGQLYQRLEYSENPNFQESSSLFLLKELYDSLGTQYVKNGNGRVREISKSKSNYDKILLTEDVGNYVNGQKDSTWVGFYKDKLSYQEDYILGKLKNGTSWDSLGKSYTYIIAEKQAEFTGGVTALMAHLRDNIKYPKKARNKGIEGRVVLKFIVEKDNSLGNIIILKNTHPLLDEEAIRVIETMQNKWIAGEIRGQVVRSYFTLPINFKID